MCIMNSQLHILLLVFTFAHVMQSGVAHIWIRISINLLNGPRKQYKIGGVALHGAAAGRPAGGANALLKC